MADFSLDLNEDQLQIQKWVHDFAEDVVRPAAHEWDEREEFPGPIIEEAAKIGLYGCDFMANAMADPTGLTLPGRGRGAVLGRRRHRAGDLRARRSPPPASPGNGTPEQVMEWVPQCYGTADKIQLGAFCVSEPDAGSDVSSLRTRAVYDEAKDEWVLNGTKAWITNGGIADVHVVVAAVDPELKGRGQASLRRPARHEGPVAGPEVQEARHPRVAHRRGRARRRARARLAACSAARRSSTPSSPGPARSAHSGEKQPAMATFEATRPTVGAQALGIARAAYEYSLDYAKERQAFGRPIIMNQAIAFKLADMATEIDAARLLVWRAAWLATNGGFQHAEGSMSKLKAGEVAVRVDRGSDPDPRRLRLHPRVPRRALAPRRQDLHDLRRHRPRSSSWSSPGRSSACVSSRAK